MQKLPAIEYEFRDEKLFLRALTHPNTGNKDNYELLEFLGDAVLNLIVSHELIKRFTNENEGALSKRRSGLVNGKVLSDIGRKLQLKKYIMTLTKDDITDKVLENAIEAIIGAIFLDSNIEMASKFVLSHLENLIQSQETPPENPKSQLQEWAQSRNMPTPNYQIISCTGEDHFPEFTMSVSIQGYHTTHGKGQNKKSAETHAAKLMLLQINDSNTAK